MLWREGYERGDYRGHIYADAAERAAQLACTRPSSRVFSSGSVARRSCCSGTRGGDLAQLFTAFFDTEIGHKRDADSYRLIADALHLRPATSSSCPTWSRNSMPRGKPACRRCCSTGARTIPSHATRMPATASPRRNLRPHHAHGLIAGRVGNSRQLSISR
jgi:hypothetical protein